MKKSKQRAKVKGKTKKKKGFNYVKHKKTMAKRPTRKWHRKLAARDARSRSRRKPAHKAFKRMPVIHHPPILDTPALQDVPRRSFPVPRQSTRLIKIVCACGWTGRTTHIWIHGGWNRNLGKHVDGGLPTCHCGKKMKVAGGDDKRHTPDVPGQRKMWMED